jgi:glycosyltransferase involved in cell wall biosynthesis
MLSCDQPALETVHLSRLAAGRPLSRCFLFLGRFVTDKGLDILVKAYEFYRESSPDPWPLICCGTGPLANRLEGQPGIHVEGFVQPERLGDKLASAGCLVLPSIFEPWGVVVHEAASAGLLILATEKVGSAVHLVQDRYNGYLVNSGDAESLAARMSDVSKLSDTRLEAMSQASHSLSKQYTPARWADTLIDACRARSKR